MITDVEVVLGIRLMHEAIVKEYNRRKGFFAKKLTVLDLLAVLDGKQSKGISAVEAIAIAKAVCKGASVVCPFVEKI